MPLFEVNPVTAKAKTFSTGRYSATREQGTHHFHLLLARFMNQGA